MADLIERIECDAPARDLDRPGRVAAVAPFRGEPVQDVADEPLDTDRLGRLPVIEVRTVTQGEPGHERPASELGGRLEGRRVV